MQLRTLLEGLRLHGLSVEVEGPAEAEISGLAYDSRAVQAGDVFFCIPGFRMDGHDFAVEAVRRGAAALVVERWLSEAASVPQARVRDARLALALLSDYFYGHPSAALGVAGITGSNGKTTTAHMAEAIFTAAGYRPGLIGTVVNRIAGEAEPSTRTTPESLDLQRLLRRMVDAGAAWVAMEVSSHALALHRVAGILFDIAVLTNITRDHFDFHQDFEHYLEAKLKLFMQLGGKAGGGGPGAKPGKLAVKTAIVNADDPHAEAFVRAARIHPNRVVGYTLSPPSRGARILYDGMVWAESIRLHPFCAEFIVRFSGAWPRGLSRYARTRLLQRMVLHIPLPGLLNVGNSLAAVAVGLSAGVSPQHIVAGLQGLPPIPGRYEIIDEGQDFAVLVDFAHNPDALATILQVPPPSRRGRRIIVFGAEGGKDQGKRPLMGQAVALHADYAIVTSDNAPREDPANIARQIEVGIRAVLDGYDGPLGGRGSPFEGNNGSPDDRGGRDSGPSGLDASLLGSGTSHWFPAAGFPVPAAIPVPARVPQSPRLVSYEVILDRREAIRHALAVARPGDLVIIAGKGHEAFQVLGGQRLPFDDRQVVRELLHHL